MRPPSAIGVPRYEVAGPRARQRAADPDTGHELLRIGEVREYRKAGGPQVDGQSPEARSGAQRIEVIRPVIADHLIEQEIQVDRNASGEHPQWVGELEGRRVEVVGRAERGLPGRSERAVS